MHVGQWEHSGIKFEGLSLAGIRTSIAIPEYSVCFDVAQGLPHSLGMKTFLITHGHLDHASGIPYIISQKAMNSHQAPRFFMPKSLVEPLTEIMKIWAKIEGHEYKYEFYGVGPGDEIEIKPNIIARPFQTVHRVDSQGYSLFRKTKKLRADLAHLSQKEIADLHRQGIDPNEISEDCIVSFTGDTQVEFLDLNPVLKKSKILMLEATYLDSQKSVASAKEWGHTHLDEIIPHLDSIESERVVLIHTSSRYSYKEAVALVAERIPEKHRGRVVLFPGR